MTGQRHLDVVAGILRDRHGRVLITERLGDTPFAGLWEFPGGKVRNGESALSALYRELREEIGVDVCRCEHFLNLSHAYSDRHVVIDFYTISEWRNEPSGCEGQAVRWSLPQHIEADLLLPADEPVLMALRAG